MLTQPHAAAIAARAAHMVDYWTRRAANEEAYAVENDALAAKKNRDGYRTTAAYHRKEAAKNLACAARAEAVAKIMQGKATDTPAPFVKVPTYVLSFVVREGDTLPMPADIKRFRDIGIERNTDNTARITCGEFAIIAERGDFGGRNVALLTCDADGHELWLMPMFSVASIRDVKAEIKTAINGDSCHAHAAILKGAGDLAAAVRFIHAARGGFRRPAEIKAARDAADEAAKAVKVEAETIPLFQGDSDDAALLADF